MKPLERLEKLVEALTDKPGIVASISKENSDELRTAYDQLRKVVRLLKGCYCDKCISILRHLTDKPEKEGG